MTVVASRRAPRAVLAETARELRELGMLQREIAEILGVSRSYASELSSSDPLGEKSRRRKLRYCGECRDCGGPTYGGEGRAKAPTRCSDCRLIYVQTEEHRESRRTWTREVLIDRIQEWASIYGEPPATPDWNPHQARRMGDEARARRWEEAGGYWPWFNTVHRVFGGWSAGLQAAGFSPRAPHGGDGNQQRRGRRR